MKPRFQDQLIAKTRSRCYSRFHFLIASMPFLIFGVVLRDMTSVVVTLILVISGLSLLVFAIVAAHLPDVTEPRGHIHNVLLRSEQSSSCQPSSSSSWQARSSAGAVSL